MAADGSRCPLRPRTGMESVGADRYVAYHENMRSVRFFEGLKGKGPKSGRFKHRANATPHVCTTWGSRYVISACRTSARFG